MILSQKGELEYTNAVVSAAEADQSESPILTDDERIDIVAARILDRFRPAFQELAE